MMLLDWWILGGLMQLLIKNGHSAIGFTFFITAFLSSKAS